MSDPSIDLAATVPRAKQIARALQGADDDEDRKFGEVDGVLLLSGKQDEDNPYKKTSSFQTWLFGYEFPSMLMVVLKERLICVGSAQKIRILTPIIKALEQDGTITCELLPHGKDEAVNKDSFDKVLKAIDGLNLGIVPKDSSKDAATGKFADEWRAAATKGSYTGTTDVSAMLAAHMAVKSAQEVSVQHTAAKASAQLMSFFADTMAKVIETQERTTHDKMAEKVEKQLELPVLWKNFESAPGSGKFDRQSTEPAYTPIIQSGGQYDVKATASSDEGRLKPGVVISSIGVRYKSYCANVARTFFVDPEKSQEANYLFLLKLQDHVLAQLKDGAILRDVYNSALDFVRAERPDLEPHFPKTLGFGTGIEMRESAYVIGPKIGRALRTDMVLSLALSFHGMEDPKDKKKTYSLLLTDTVQIGADGAKTLSSLSSKKMSEVAFYFQDEQPKKSKANGAESNRTNGVNESRTSRSAVVRSKLRNEGKGGDDGQAARRQEHQRELLERRQQEGLEKYGEGGEGAGKGTEVKAKTWKRFASYEREQQIPDAAADGRIVVDNRRNTIILPINGFAVPFHVNTLKNVIKQEEGEYTTLRFMFITPGQIAGKKEDTLFEDPNASFIRTLTFRSSDSYRFTEVHKEITNLKKEATKRETEKKEMADVVEQDNLIEERARRPARLRDVWVRPPFEGKRSTGDVEIHQNGIRWASAARNDHKIDVLFSNMRHLLFQPCDNELLVIIHISLKSPIMVGKKKVRELQFFREASEAAFDETGNKKRRRNADDQDEIELEQAERKLRRELNKEFKAYADKIADASRNRVEVDMPFRELGFQGVPHRSGVLIMPTTDCLVHLAEFPPFVLTIADVEIVHLERVQFGLKNFDIVFVLNDFTKAPLHINTVPMSQLDSVKDWLDSIDLPFTEGPVNLNWTQIMNTVKDDIYAFFREGGWSFLQTDTTGGDDDDDDSEDEKDAFEPDSSDVKAESESDYSGEGDSDADDGDFGGDDDISDIASDNGESDQGSSDGGKKRKKK